ncbi:MAG: DUF6067 family protein, partial [Planctomycetota bacterium]|nr:DUF6067 family protein [Planctomycetota bacterium]
MADINGLAKDAKLTRLVATVRERDTKKEVDRIEFSIDGFRDGRSEGVFPTVWLNCGVYEIAMKGEGEKVPPGEVIQTFERHIFPWEEAPRLGTSTEAYPPFTPIEVKGNVLKTVLREHTLGPLGLPEQIACTSAQTGVTKPILAAPMRLVARSTGKATSAAVTGEIAFYSREVQGAPAESVMYTDRGFLFGGLRYGWDYDGCVSVTMDLGRSKGDAATKFDELTFEIPLRADVATMIHANADRIRAPVAQRLPAGEGVVWDASKVACDDYINNFCPYVYLGDAVRGLCWFAENDYGWSWDRKTPNLDVVRQGDQVILRVHFINKPTVIDKPRTITFGLLAAPVKPRLSPGGPNGWRSRYMRDKYALLGTDINWFGVGCGSVYPIDRDLDLWKMLARGNKEKLS